MDKLAMVDIDKRLNRLLKVVEWVCTDVTSSLGEKAQASADYSLSEAWVVFNLNGNLSRNDLVSANELWEKYIINLTGSNVPLYIKRIVEGR